MNCQTERNKMIFQTLKLLKGNREKTWIVLLYDPEFGTTHNWVPQFRIFTLLDYITQRFGDLGAQ